MLNRRLWDNMLGHFDGRVGLQRLELLLAVLLCLVGVRRVNRLCLQVLGRNRVAVVALALVLTNIDSAVIQLFILALAMIVLISCIAALLLLP